MWDGLDKGKVKMAPYTNMPDDVKKMPEATEAAIRNKTLHPFKCPIVKQDGAQVVVVKFNDYQCPSCRQAYVEYRGIVAKYEREYAGRVKFVTLDFPLEAECNVASIHPAACEAAAAVRLARTKGRDVQMEEWLFARQPELTPDRVKEAYPR